ncbi:hypothetical protein ZIOFF_045648 [Zingiber officinale]|uniref:Hikeshi-like C-terminal domain-containing protein n=1 Tax=Zingiber officinale TaxID=94328 RepID=A0A8J5G7E3_ZINOF|nr:hypothetical protein ZIOFF_045648 [Zingiber officinale]
MQQQKSRNQKPIRSRTQPRKSARNNEKERFFFEMEHMSKRMRKRTALEATGLDSSRRGEEREGKGIVNAAPVVATQGAVVSTERSFFCLFRATKENTTISTKRTTEATATAKRATEATAISTANLRYFFSSSEEPPIPDPNPNPLQLALTFAKIGVSVKDLASLPPVADAGAEKKAERLALRVGENLFNFMQYFCGIDGSRLVVPMDILDRWFKKFQERARKDPSYLKGFAL